MCNFRGCRLFEDGGDNCIFESNFDNGDFFVYIPMYILIKLIIDNLSTLLSISLIS